MLLVAAGILPVAVVSGFALLALVDHQKERAKQSGIEITRALSIAVDAELQRTISVLETLALDRHLDTGDLASYHSVLARAVATRPEWRIIILHDAHGRLLLNTSREFGSRLPATAESESLARALRTRRPTVGVLARGLGDTYAVPVRVPVIRENELRFVLTAVVRPDLVVDVVNRQRLPADWVVSVFDGGGSRVARSRQHREFLGQPPSATLKQLMDAGASEGAGMVYALEGERVYAAYTRSPSTGWTVAIGIPPSVVESAAVGSLVAYGGGALLSIALGVVAALVLGRRITVPMAALSAAAKALGRRASLAPPKTDIREIRDVADSLVAAADERAHGEAQREELLVSEREARAAAEGSEQRAGALAALAADISESLDLDTVLQRVVEGGRQLASADAAWIALREGDACVFRYLSGVRSARWRETPVREGRGMGGQALRTGRSVRTDDYERDPRFTGDYLHLVREEGIVAQLVVPIHDGERVTGLFYVANRSSRVFTQRDEALCAGLAAHAAIAIRNSQLYQSERAARAEAEYREREAGLLAELTRAINSSLDLDTVLQRILRGATELCAADTGAVSLRAADADVLVARHAVGADLPADEAARIEPADGVGGRVMRSGRPFRTARLAADAAGSDRDRAIARSTGTTALLAVPIVIDQRVDGILYLGRRASRPFTDEEEAICLRLAAQASVAVQNARLYDHARRRQREAEGLATVASTINTLDLDAALQNITESACALLQAHVATVFRLDAESGALTLVAGGGTQGMTPNRNVVVPRSTGLVGLAVERREAVVSADLLTDERIVYTPEMRARIEAARHRVGVAVPLMVKGRITGALFVGALPGRSFSPDDVRLVRAFADEAAVAIANAELYHDAQRASRAKDEFLAMLGHELRNPLSAITSAAGVLGLATDAGPSAERACTVIRRQVQHLSRLVDDLLDVSRVTSGKVVLLRQPMDLAELASATVASWRASGRFARHRVAVDASPVWIDADETRMEQVLGNLLGNALKYTPSGGAIAVRVRSDGEAAILEVEDTGVGIPSTLVERVFDLFVQGERTLDRAQGGLGIGLTLAKALVEMHGGTVEAKSGGPGHGATFTVRVPRILTPVRAPAVPAAPRRGAPRRGAPRRILVIEDNADGREMLRVQLALEGHEVHEAVDGETGVALAAAVAPDVALVDIGLPGIDGYEVARRIRAGDGGQSLLLVAITGYGQPEDRRRALEAGFDAHLTKPVLPERLAELLAGARAQRSVTAASP